MRNLKPRFVNESIACTSYYCTTNISIIIHTQCMLQIYMYMYHSCSNVNYTNMTYFAKRQNFFLLFPLTWWIVDTHIDKRLVSHHIYNAIAVNTPPPLFKLKTPCKQKRRQFFTSRREQMIETICRGFANIRNLLSTAPSKKNVNSSFQTGLTSLSLVFVRLRPSGAVFIRRMRYGSGVSTVTNNINET